MTRSAPQASASAAGRGGSAGARPRPRRRPAARRARGPPRPARDVGAGAEVGGGDDHRRDRVRGRVERRRRASRGQAVGDPQLGVELGRDEGRPHPAQHQPVDHRGVDVALDDDPVAAVGERQAGGVVALRGAVDQEPGARRPPGLGGEQLRLLEGGRFGADVDPLGDRGDVVAQAASPTSSPIAGSAPAPPLWPGTWKRPGSRAA